MKAYAASIGTTTSFQTIIDAAMANNIAAPSRHMANNYREALKILYIIDEVQPFFGIGKFNQTLIGKLLESFVYQSLIVYTDANDAQLYHFLDARGTREIDFIL